MEMLIVWLHLSLGDDGDAPAKEMNREMTKNWILKVCVVVLQDQISSDWQRNFGQIAQYKGTYHMLTSNPSPS